MKKYSFILILLFFSLYSCIDEPKLEENNHLGNFESLWKIIDTRYCYLDYKKINWDSIHTVYKTRVDSNMTDIQLFELFGNMLGELKDGHVNLYSDFNTSRYWKWFTDYPSNFNSTVVYGNRYLGTNYMVVGGLRYAKIRNGEIGYIYYGDFSDRFSDVNITNIFTYFKNCKALIIDVRNNGGGYLDLSEQFASYFFTQKTVTGYMQHKTGNGHTQFSKAEAITTPAHETIQWQLPVAVLSNRMSYSATNAFISKMKIAPNAVIVGDKSGGGGGLPLSSELPNGWMVRFSSSPMFDATMQHTEWGIDPDVKVDLKPADVENGYDTIIETAISHILK
jgi:hypothetical protein